MSVLFLTQYYRGLGHSMRIKHIMSETSNFLPCTVVHHLLKPPIDYIGAKEYTLLPDRDMDFEAPNPFKVIMKPELIQKRIDSWREIIDSERPRVVVFEGFPFCRHQFAYELFTMMEYVRDNGAILVCSIRDFPWDEPHERGLQDWVAKTQNWIIKDFFDAVLIHGDKDCLPLLPDIVNHYNPRVLLSELNPYLVYTGYVVNPDQKKHKKQNNHIYVSLGLNKPENINILRQFTQIAKLFPEYKFILPIANKYQKGLFTEVDGVKFPPAKTKDNIIVIDFLPELYKLIESCALFITYGGYNSTMEILASQCPAVVIPRRDGKKLEQFTRAHTMAPYGCFQVCDVENINNIDRYMDKALNTAPKPFPFKLDGAERSAEILCGLYN